MRPTNSCLLCYSHSRLISMEERSNNRSSRPLSKVKVHDLWPFLDYMTFCVYKYAARGLYEANKLMVTLLLTLKIDLGPVAKFQWSVWPYSRLINTIRQRQCVTCVTNFWILIISIHTSRFGNRIKQIWQPLLFINGYLRKEYTLFQDFARKIPCPVQPTGRPGRVQSGCTPEFGYGPLNGGKIKP